MKEFFTNTWKHRAHVVMALPVFLILFFIMYVSFTYKFLYVVLDIITKIQYENGSNMTYKKVYEKIGFDYTNFFVKAKTNGYIKRSEIDNAQTFFKNLGKRDKDGEKEYIEHNRSSISAKVQRYYADYNEIKKSHFMCGVAAGLLIIIFFI